LFDERNAVKERKQWDRGMIPAAFVRPVFDERNLVEEPEENNEIGE
jgi:hypothetical protein